MNRHRNPGPHSTAPSSAPDCAIPAPTDDAGAPTWPRRGSRRAPGRTASGRRGVRAVDAVRGVRAGRADRLRPHGVTLVVTGQIPEPLRERVIADYHRANLLRAHQATRRRVASGDLPLPVPYGYRLTRPERPGRAGAQTGPSRDWRPDACTGWVVELIFWWRSERIAVADIVGMLAGSPSLYPRPCRRDGRERFWTAAIVRRILADPSYTGHTVWGRTRRGRPVRPGEWIVSPTPTHPALVRRSVFDDLNDTCPPVLGR